MFLFTLCFASWFICIHTKHIHQSHQSTAQHNENAKKKNYSITLRRTKVNERTRYTNIYKLVTIFFSIYAENRFMTYCTAQCVIIIKYMRTRLSIYYVYKQNKFIHRFECASAASTKYTLSLAL